MHPLIPTILINNIYYQQDDNNISKSCFIKSLFNFSPSFKLILLLWMLMYRDETSKVHRNVLSWNFPYSLILEMMF